MNSFNRLIKVNRILREEIKRRDLPVTWVESFLLVAAAGTEGVSLPDLAKEVGVTQGISSRIMIHMSVNINPVTQIDEGFHLVVAEMDPHRRHAKRVYLSPKGKRVAQKIEECLSL